MSERPVVAWSFSALSDFKNCPHKYYRVKVRKDVSDVNAANADGDNFHHAFDQYITKGASLPARVANFQPMLERVRRSPGEVYSEFKMCLDMNYVPCDFKDWNRAFVRAINDVLIVNGSVAKMIDWKFGKPRKDPEQNALASAVVFRHFPKVERVDSAYVYPFHNKIVPFAFHRAEEPGIWGQFLPDVNLLAQAKVRDEWPKKPNPLCGWCPVTDCQHNKNTALQDAQRGPT